MKNVLFHIPFILCCLPLSIPRVGLESLPDVIYQLSIESTHERHPLTSLHRYHAFKRISTVSINCLSGVRIFFINHGSLVINIFAFFLLMSLLKFGVISFEPNSILYFYYYASVSLLPHLKWDPLFSFT